MKTVQFLAIVLTALALIPGGAHLFALPNKLAMTEQAYFAAQQAYRGWALFGAILIAAIVANALLAFVMREQRLSLWFAIAAAALLCTTLVVFFVWTYPTNELTQNWTSVPPAWAELRARWEYSHAANAVITFVSLCCSILSALCARN